MNNTSNRREALMLMGAASGLGLAAMGSAPVEAEAAAGNTPAAPEGTMLREFGERLARAPRRRDFKTVPMILTEEDQWDHDALKEVISYGGARRQVWDNTDLGGPWLNVMRNSLNAQVWSFKHADFLVVSATHGSAHLALFEQEMWDKYKLADLTGGKFKTNTLIKDRSAALADGNAYENANGVFSAANNSIPALQRRGVVFLACHNSIWEIAGRLVEATINPDALSQEALAAELTNHLISGVVVTPGAAATLPELQAAGFHYAK
ncbi:transcriptional initiation protein Tat [Methylocella tundrae]|nr:transcriptional initiation protein Tat [Methylocella tundrae]WPP03008.1 transcriptional initiation protein Tat [Methylocella tundrae]